MTEEPRIYSGEKTVSAVNGVGKAGYQHVKEGNWTTILYKSAQNVLKT